MSIDRIVGEGGRATGIALADGRTVRASQFVASTIDVHTTLEDMLGREQLPEPFRKKLDNFGRIRLDTVRADALHESPSFAAAFDPNVNRAMKWSLGAESMQDLFDAHQDVAAGRIRNQFGRGRSACSIRPRHRPASTPPMPGM